MDKTVTECCQLSEFVVIFNDFSDQFKYRDQIGASLNALSYFKLCFTEERTFSF